MGHAMCGQCEKCVALVGRRQVLRSAHSALVSDSILAWGRQAHREVLVYPRGAMWEAKSLWVCAVHGHAHLVVAM